MNSNEYITFLHKFINNPKQVGSIIPSSKFLAKKMVNPVYWDEVKAVAELGAGTGAITKYIEKEASNSTQVLLFEMDLKMRTELQNKYPNYSCSTNAINLVKVMNSKGIKQLDCIISGLPFFNFSSGIREALLEQVTAALKPGGLFIAFQYSLQMKKLLSERFTIEAINFTPFNIPSAFIYVCSNKKSFTEV